MTLAALQHLIRSAKALAEDREILILGSASLLATFPELGLPDAPLAATFDADICPQPYDEITAVMLDEALGENRAYYLRHGYHADILRDTIFETLPGGWRDRLIAVPGPDGGLALEPHDLTAVKILVGRPKDLDLVQNLHRNGKIRAELVKERLDLMTMDERGISRASIHFREIFSEI
ncbi:MAG: hypothetical protein JNJ70_12170 [Verrucomicrobiales bacterium]|nr:hypothetical protein [Verrucomicrobiales bacterium]